MALGIGEEPLFVEVQYFRQLWILILVGFVALLSWIELLFQIIFQLPFGTHPVANFIAWILWALFGISLPLLFLFMNLTVEVRSNGIHISFPPIMFSKTIAFSDLRSYRVRQYSPLAEYGGWGARWSLKNGWAYNVSGDMGVQLELKNNKKILIGSQRSEELAQAIEKAISQNTQNQD